ncbi:MAG: TadE/TadG family type IV pilus assembly protein [Sphingomicrobium sp.]
MMRRLWNIVRDESGTSLIEMALVMPVLAGLTIGMVDIARGYSSKLALEQAAQRAIEKVQQYQSTSSTYNLLATEAASAARDAGFTTAADTDVAIDYWLECNGVRQGDGTAGNGYTSSCSSGQTNTRYISLAITQKFKPLFGTKYFPGANSDGTYTIKGTAAIRTQ